MAKAHTTNVVAKYHQDGRVENVNEKMTLEQMQEFVGGSIEMVPSTISRRVLVCDEEYAYKMHILKPNDEASKLVRRDVAMMNGRLHGNVLLVKD